MIKVENIETYGWQAALRGMRNPMNSWAKSDTTYGCQCKGGIQIGENDLRLMKQLFKAGTEHRKFMRQIFVSMDITAPTFFWLQFDTYKVGVTSNSTSKMHKLMAKEFTADDFSFDALSAANSGEEIVSTILKLCNHIRECYLDYEKLVDEGKMPKDTAKSDVWRTLLEYLPESYNQKRTVTMNYEVAATMIKQRENHKLAEWHSLVDTLKELPYMSELLKTE